MTISPYKGLPNSFIFRLHKSSLKLYSHHLTELTSLETRQKQSICTAGARRALFQDVIEQQVELPFAQTQSGVSADSQEANSTNTYTSTSSRTATMAAPKPDCVELEPCPTQNIAHINQKSEDKTEAATDETDSGTPSISSRMPSRQSTSFAIFIRKVHCTDH